MIHVIDGVLSPTSVVDVALNNSNFAQLVEKLSEAGPFTIFAPTDDAFTKVFSGLWQVILKSIPVTFQGPLPGKLMIDHRSGVFRGSVFRNPTLHISQIRVKFLQLLHGIEDSEIRSSIASGAGSPLPVPIV